MIDPGDDWVPADDAVIAVAFRRSLLALAALAALGGLLLWKAKRPAAREADRPIPIAAPPPATAAAEPPRLPFRDVTERAGIDFFRINGAYGDQLLPEALGGGAAFFDYDGDGDPDLLLVNADYWPHAAPSNARPTMALYRNEGGGRFADISRRAGLELTFYGMGVAVGDYDNDGDPDLFFPALGTDHLLRNDGGVFRGVTAEAGVGGGAEDWGTSAGFFDYDRDGDLDLFVCNFVRWSRRIDMWLDYRLEGFHRSYGPPENYEGSDSVLYRNEGDGTFTDVSAQAGIRVRQGGSQSPIGKALALAPVDVDGDHLLDVLVTNSTVRNFFFHNRGDGTFTEEGVRLNLAFDRSGRAATSTGVDFGDYQNRGRLAFFLANSAATGTGSLLVSGAAEGRPSVPGAFVDLALSEGIGAPSRLPVGFGLLLLDVDLDGRLDVLQANGHLEEQIQRIHAYQRYEQAAQLLWNSGAGADRGAFVEVPASWTGDLGSPLVGRGATYADIDGDGDLDVLLTQPAGRPRLLRNDQQLGHHWLRVRLAGSPALGTNREAIGARVEVTAGGITQERQVMPARSYLSQVELPVSFGLRRAQVVDLLRVVWPDGSSQVLRGLAADRVVVVEQAPTGGPAPDERSGTGPAER